MIPRLLFVLAALLLVMPLQAAAGVSFSLEPVPDGSYAVVGNGLEGAAALDFSVRYDTALLARPVVTRGMVVPVDAGFFANTAIAGEIRIMMVRNREFTGSGALAGIAFERLTGVGGILSFKANPVSVAAVPLEAQAGQTARSIIRPEEQATESRASAGPVPARPSSSGVSVGTGTGPALNRPSAGETGDVSATEASGLSPDIDRQPGGTDAQSVAVAGHTRRFPSVLESFHDFSGERTPAALLALFDAGERGMVQEPAVALSDGAGTVILRVVAREGNAPVFNLEKASLADIRTEEGEWVLTVVPEPGTCDSRLLITDGDLLSGIPLVVAPPLRGVEDALSLDEAGLAQLLAGGDDRFDLNGDGVLNYIDEYLLAANIRAVRLRGR